MRKCPCMQAIWEIDIAWDEEIQLAEGDTITCPKQVRDILLPERKYAKECKWCPWRKRKSLDNDVIEEEVEHPISSQLQAIDASVLYRSQSSEKYEAPSETEGSLVMQGPCDSNLAIARLAAPLEKDLSKLNYIIQ